MVKTLFVTDRKPQEDGVIQTEYLSSFLRAVLVQQEVKHQSGMFPWLIVSYSQASL